MSTTNKEIVRREIEEIINKGDFTVVDQLIAEDYVAYDPAEPEPERGRDGYRASMDSFREAFADLDVRIDDQIAEGDKVVTRWTFTGRHDGEMYGIPPTGKEVEFTGISIERVVDGRIVEDRMNWDTLGLMQQLGVVPKLAPEQ